MILKKMSKQLKIILIITYVLCNSVSLKANNAEFNIWVKNFKKEASLQGVSSKVLNDVLLNVKYLPKVIEYDRYQPEFYEDTFTYIKKRTNKSKVRKGLDLYKKEKILINKVEKKFLVEKELLISLMGIETNYGKYLGKMDIVSSLATLSFDKRRSEFFTNELIVLLKLVDLKIINKNILFGSWAGAFGNFQFMPSTIQKFAIDYNKNSSIELKQIEDSFASAANYINKIGWKKNEPCFYKVELKENIPSKYLNSSARKITNKKKVKFFYKYLKNSLPLEVDENFSAAIITPDKDIIPGSNTIKPAFLVFNNYEKILKWNRSLRFALAVCTLKDKLKNEI
jgi:membrane-bound lytic murein transglycosylase B